MRLEFKFQKQVGELSKFKKITAEWVFGEPGINHASCMVSRWVYVYGGYGKGGATFAGTCRLDVKRRKWVPVITNGLEPIARCGQSGTLVEDKFLVAGGWNNVMKFDLDHYLIVLDLALMEWSSPETWGTAPKQQYMHSMTWYAPKRIMVQFGGKSTRGAHNDLYFLNLDSMEWTKPATNGQKPPIRFMHGASIIGTQLYIFGGKVTQRSRLNDMHILNLKTATPQWSKVAAHGDIPPLIGGVTMDRYAGQFIVFGGKRVDTHESSDVYTFDPLRNKWSLVSTHTGFGNFRHTSHIQGSSLFIIGSPFVKFENYVKVRIKEYA